MRQTNIHDSRVYATSMKTYVIDIKQNTFIVMYYKHFNKKPYFITNYYKTMAFDINLLTYIKILW